MKKWNKKMVLLYGISFLTARFHVGGIHPLVMALYGGMCTEPRLSRKGAFLTLLAGVASAVLFGEAASQDALLRYGISMLVVLFVVSIAEGSWPRQRTGQKPERTLSAVAMALIVGLVTAGVRAGGTLLTLERDGIQAVLEGVLASGMTIVLRPGIHDLLYPPKERERERVELISVVTLILAALCGFPEWIEEFSPVYMGAVLAVLYLGYYYGIGSGTVAGALSGVVLGIQSGQMDLVGCFAMLGMISPVVGELGKVPVCLVWLMLTGTLGFVWEDSLLSRESLLATLPALILFLLIRRKKEEGEEEQPIYSSMQAVTRERLKDISAAFHKLAELMTYPAEVESGLAGRELNRIFNQVSESCCAGCERREICMKAEFFDTYHDVFQILDQAEKSGYIDPDEIPVSFLERCIRAEYFLGEAGRQLELARTNLIWRNRMAENRVVVAEQFAGVAGMMDDVVLDLGIQPRECQEEEQRVRECMTSVGVEVCQTAVKRREDGRSEIFVTARMTEGGCMTTRELATLLGQTLRRSYHSSFSSKSVISGEWATLTFLEDTAFCFYSGVAACGQEGEQKNGDNYSIQELAQGEALLVLSDGMGSGNQAFRESARMVELLEQFLDAGMESAAAIKMIQSSLFLRGGLECFATVDLFRIDLCTGICRYLKAGAADSFLVRGNRVERLTSPCLPAGILRPQDLEEQAVKFYEGDFLVMVTDGFLDCFEEGQAEEIILSVIRGRKQNNAKELARVLLDSALIHCGGSPGDDITVLVTGFWENEGLASEAVGW